MHLQSYYFLIIDNTMASCDIPLTHVAVEVADGASDAAVDKLIETGRSSRFIIVVNNKTGYTLTRKNSRGKLDSWPFGTIKKDECVSSFFEHEKFMSFCVEYTAPDLKPGVHTVTLSGSWPLVGYRKIGVFGGRNADHAWKNLKSVSDCADTFGNKATIRQVSHRSYVYEYELMKLGFEQYAVTIDTEGDEAIQNALDLFATKEKLPGFVFIVHNRTEYDLYLEETKVERIGSWPLQNVGKKECAIGGLQRKVDMSLAVQYTARDATPQQRSIALAGSWPFALPKKINISSGKGARYAWDNLIATSVSNDKGNRAYIETKIEGSAIYVYDITNI